VKRVAGAAVLVVAAIAATVSYTHIERLAVQLGQPELAAWLMPLSVDGTVLAASAALLHSARREVAPPRMARPMLALGILATLAANADFGTAHGSAGIVLSAWPAVAFIGTAEVAFGMARAPAPEPAPDVLANGCGVPEGGKEAAEKFSADLAKGEIPSVRRVRREMHLGQPRAQQVQAYLAALASA
jgi:hypothetical protein